MKYMKKMLSLLLALALVMSLGITAFAAEPGEDDPVVTVQTGTITINNAYQVVSYDVYRILDLVSYDKDAGAYLYRPASDEWAAWIDDTNAGGKYLAYENGLVTMRAGATAADLAAAAIAYAEQTPAITPVATEPAVTNAEGDARRTVTFENLPLGYYLVKSGAGVVCSLDTNAPDVNITEKNNIPEIIKKVLDQSGNTQEQISEFIGKEVTFLSRITFYAGTYNLVYEDKMDPGLTFVDGSIQVYYTPMADGDLVDPENYEIKTGSDKDNPESDFEIHFDDEFVAQFTSSTQLTIVYKAVVNENAEIAPDANTNAGRVTFGREGKTTWDTADVLTYKFGIAKTNTNDAIIEGAGFALYAAIGPLDSNHQHTTVRIPVVKITPEGAVDGYNYYRPATPEEIAAGGEGYVGDTIEAGVAIIVGIRSGVTLYLEETVVPEGYSGIEGLIHVNALTGNNEPVVVNGVYQSGGVDVENKTGTVLPSTGGMGTTLFYVFGGLMVAAAVVLLMTKKRMGSET